MTATRLVQPFCRICSTEPKTSVIVVGYSVQSAAVVEPSGQSITSRSLFQVGNPPQVTPVGFVSWRLAPMETMVLSPTSASSTP